MQQENQTVPAPETYTCIEDEIDLADLLRVLWRRKTAIVLTALVLTGFSIIYCLIVTKKYLISAQITPGITGYTDDTPIHALETADLKTWFDKKAYYTALKGVVPETEMGKIKISASVPRGSNIVTLNLYWPKKTQGKKILGSIIGFLSAGNSQRLKKSLEVSRRTLLEQIEKKKNALTALNLKKDELERKIKLEKARASMIQENIRLLQEKIDRTKALIENLSKEVKKIDENTRELMTLRNRLAKTAKKDGLSLLMYTNIIQQNLSYATQIKKSISTLSNKITDLELAQKQKRQLLEDTLKKIEDLESEKNEHLPLERARINTEVATLKAKLDSLAPVEVVQPPYSSLRPVKPRTLTIVALAAVLGVFIGIFLAFLTEFVVKNRERIAGET